MTTLASNVRSVLLSASEIGPPQKLARKTVLFQQGQQPSGIFLIEQGLIKLTRTSNGRGKLILAVAGPHQLVGEECLSPRVGSLFVESMCLTDVTGYYIPLAIVKRLLSNQGLFFSVFEYLLARNREFMQKVEMHVFHDVEYRILQGLATLAALSPATSGSLFFSIPMTQAEIASFVGATRETTSTILGALQERNLVTLSRRLVTTVHPDILKDAANYKLASGSILSR